MEIESLSMAVLRGDESSFSSLKKFSNWHEGNKVMGPGTLMSVECPTAAGQRKDWALR